MAAITAKTANVCVDLCAVCYGSPEKGNLAQPGKSGKVSWRRWGFSCVLRNRKELVKWRAVDWCSMLRKYSVSAGRSSPRLVVTQFPLLLASYSTDASSSAQKHLPRNTHSLLCWLCPFKHSLALQRKADQASLEPYLVFPVVLVLWEEVNCRDSAAGG